MPTIIYIESNGIKHETEVAEGNSILQGAIDNMISGFEAECGGSGACATCHCYVDNLWKEKITLPEKTEKEMLEMVTSPQKNSRLSCQIKVTKEMNGLIIHLPESQY